MSNTNQMHLNLYDSKIDLQRDLIRSTVGDKIFYKETSLGYKFLTRIYDNYGLDFIFSNSTGPFYAEPFTSKLICDIASKDGGIGIFAGGYIGDIAIPAAKSGMSCIGFEPDYRSRDLFIKNCILNGVQVEISEMGLYETRGQANLLGQDATSTIFSNGKPSLESAIINLIDLDSYLEDRQVDLESINLIQLDMEGAESGALIGACNLLTNYSPFLVVEIHSLYDSFNNGLHNTNTCNILKDYGYDVFCLRDYNTHFIPPGDFKYELIPIEKCYLDGPPHGFNLIAFKNNMPIPSESYIFVENVSPKLIPHKADNSLFRLNQT